MKNFLLDFGRAILDYIKGDGKAPQSNLRGYISSDDGATDEGWDNFFPSLVEYPKG